MEGHLHPPLVRATKGTPQLLFLQFLPQVLPYIWRRKVSVLGSLLADIFIFARSLMSEYNTGIKLLLLLGLVVGAYLLFSLLGMAVGMGAFGVGLDEIMNLESYRSIQALKIVQIITTTGVFIVTPFVFVRILKKDFHSYYKLDQPLNERTITIVLFTVLGALPLIGFMAGLNNAITFPESLSWLEESLRSAEDQAMKVTMAFLQMETIPELTYNLVLVAVLPAFGEELLFRGALQKLLIDRFRNVHIGIWTAAIIFSAFHNQFYGFIPRMLLGAAFGYIVVWGGSLWYAIIAHFVNNSVGVVLHYYVLKNQISPTFEDFGSSPDHLLFVVISTFIALGGFYLIWFLNTKRLKES